MKTSSRPFKARHDSGRCPICTKHILKGETIQRLENTANWWEDKASDGIVIKVICYADYVHASCLEERNEDV